MPSISIIMGVYNCKNFTLLKNSVLSIVNQTYKDWEFIICDDGSTNDTLLFLNELSALDSRIRIISYKENKGLAFALNRCLSYARGKYIARQDDDDLSYPERLEKQIAFLMSNKQYRIVGTLAHIYDDSGIWGNYELNEKPNIKSFLWNSPFIHPSIMMYKDDLLKVGGYRVSKETRRCEDYDLFMRMYASDIIGYNIQEKLYQYRIVRSDKKYRAMEYRIDEAIVRFKGYRALGILLIGLPYIIKPILIGLLSQRILNSLKKVPVHR